jgi:hypothetical protein
MRAFLPIGWLLVATACPARAQPHCAPIGSSSRGARPVAVLFQHSPWTGGTDRPLFILYEDGRVIYPHQRSQGHPVSYRTACLEERPADLRARFALGPELRGLRKQYDYRPGWSDQESVLLFAWFGDTLTRVTVRAGRTGIDRFSDQVPAPFREAYRRMVEFRDAGADPWEPETLEVAIWPYEYAPDNPPLQWPKDWPDLESPGTRHEADALVEEVNLIYLAGGQRQRLDELLSRRRERQAVAINGRKWAVGYRMQFPGEARWRPLIKNLEM